jgi:hypothetical protein
MEESVTDPNLNAWYDRRGGENADKCAWTFGATLTASNGWQYNMTLKGKQYLIRQNWVNASGGYCALSYCSRYSARYTQLAFPAFENLWLLDGILRDLRNEASIASE